MAERRNCSFCGNSIEPGTGRMYVRVDGSVFFFDRHKCYQNFVSLKRIPRETRWSSLSMTSAKWKDRPAKAKSAAARVYAPKKRAPRESAAATDEAEPAGAPVEASPADEGETPEPGQDDGAQEKSE